MRPPVTSARHGDVSLATFHKLGSLEGIDVPFRLLRCGPLWTIVGRAFAVLRLMSGVVSVRHALTLARKVLQRDPMSIRSGWG